MSSAIVLRSPIKPITWIADEQRVIFEAAGTTAHRIASGSDGWLERLGDDVMISHKNDVALSTIIEGMQKWCAASSWRPSRVFTRFLPFRNQERVPPVLHSGDATLPIHTVVSEAGIRYGLDFGTGYSHGLFLDQRGNRAKLRAMRPKMVLNTFSYTCSFSLVAALAGAETLSVDLSRKSLDRGKQNFLLNGIDEDRHRFVADDALDLLPRLQHRGERFDVIILDPPTFSRGNQGRLWQVEQHLEDLISAALEVSSSRCSILLSTNCTKIDHIALERQARSCAKVKRRATQFFRTAPEIDFPEGHGARTVWMMVR